MFFSLICKNANQTKQIWNSEIIQNEKQSTARHCLFFVKKKKNVPLMVNSFRRSFFLFDRLLVYEDSLYRPKCIVKEMRKYDKKITEFIYFVFYYYKQIYLSVCLYIYKYIWKSRCFLQHGSCFAELMCWRRYWFQVVWPKWWWSHGL